MEQNGVSPGVAPNTLVPMSENSSNDKNAEGSKSCNDLISKVTPALEHFQNEVLQTLRRTGELGQPACEHIGRALAAYQVKPPVDAKPVDWLFFVDITTKDFRRGDNLKRRLDEFQALAGETKGKPIAIALQIANSDLNGIKDPNSDFYEFFIPTPYHIDRYIIHDGSMNKVDTVNSEGYAGDVTNLLRFGRQQFNGGNKALIVDSHGTGNSGLSGDTGEVTTRDFVRAVQKGMKQIDDETKPPKTSEQEKLLDLVDFDTCLMAQNGVLNSLRQITDHLVASPETEGGIGQDHDKIVRHALANPGITPSDLGKAIVENARLQSIMKTPEFKPIKNVYEFFDQVFTPLPVGRDHIPVRTLSYFNLTKFETFNTKLDSLGDVLVQSIKDPMNRKTIDDLIDATASYGDDKEYDWPGDAKDMRKFVEGLMDGIEAKKINDADGSLRIACGRVLDAHKQLVVSYSGFGKYGARGGLTEYLPSRWFLDFHKGAIRDSEILEFESLCNEPANIAEKKGEFLEQQRKQLERIDKDITKQATKYSEEEIVQVRNALKKATSAVDALETAADLKATFAALLNMKEAAKAMKRSDFCQKQLIEQERQHKQEIDKAYEEQMVDSSTGWGRFITALRRLD